MFACITKVCVVAILAASTNLPGAREAGEGIAVARYAGLAPDAVHDSMARVWSVPRPGGADRSRTRHC